MWGQDQLKQKEVPHEQDSVNGGTAMGRQMLSSRCRPKERTMTTTATPDDTLLPLNRIKTRASGRDGESPHISTMIRWATRGARLRDGSRMRLRAIKTPGGWRSCAAWVDEFFDALTRDRLGIDAEDHDSRSHPAPAHPPRTPGGKPTGRRNTGIARLLIVPKPSRRSPPARPHREVVSIPN